LKFGRIPADSKGVTRLAATLVVLALVFAAGAAADGSGPQQPATAADTSAQSITAVAELEHELLGGVNQVRKAHGLVPLRLNAQLAAVARDHSRSMAQFGYFRHTSEDGSAFWQRIRPVYPSLPGRSWSAGENMVWASPGLSAAQAVGMWMHSPEHRKNMLTPSWREIGIGGVHALAAPGVYQGLDVTIVTADFGVR